MKVSLLQRSLSGFPRFSGGKCEGSCAFPGSEHLLSLLDCLRSAPHGGPQQTLDQTHPVDREWTYHHPLTQADKGSGVQKSLTRGHSGPKASVRIMCFFGISRAAWEGKHVGSEARLPGLQSQGCL